MSDLSGGQMQRVAIARGLAVQPSVLLLDEPLSALDLKLRQHMRTELRKIQRRTGVTFIYITHDQGEALTMSDRIGVMTDQGVIDQVAASDELYNQPRTAFVADFVGENNAFVGQISDASGDFAVIRVASGRIKGRNPQRLAIGQRAMAFVRPEAILMKDKTDNGQNEVACTVENLTFEGAYITVFLKTAENERFVMRQNNDGTTPLLAVGTELAVGFDAANTLLLAFGEVSNA